MKESVRYSEAFKRGMVERLECGNYKSLEKASRRNGIKGSGTVTGWVKKYGREDILPKRMKVETMKEIDELQAARKEIKELKAALADAHVDWCLESAFLDIACEQAGDNGGSVKKNTVVSLADMRRRKGRV